MIKRWRQKPSLKPEVVLVRGFRLPRCRPDAHQYGVFVEVARFLSRSRRSRDDLVQAALSFALPVVWQAPFLVGFSLLSRQTCLHVWSVQLKIAPHTLQRKLTDAIRFTGCTLRTSAGFEKLA